MEKTEADGQPPKASGEREQPRSLPYSLETPYGFHLDLDFLKYVDDIEKGNTIRRVHIHRRAKQPKFSTLPRNFSLPENGSRGCTTAPSKSWTATCSFPQRKASLGEETPRALLPSEAAPPAADEPSYRRKALLAETRRQAELGWQEGELRERPQLLRASSMPDALPPSQTPLGDGRGLSPLRPPPQHCHDQSGSESTFRSSSDSTTLNLPRAVSLEQDISFQHLSGVIPGLVPLQPPWQNQHASAPQLQVVMESGGEEGDAADASGCSDVAGGEPASPAALQLMEENTNPGERGLSVSEMALNVLKEGEEGNVQAGEDKESGVPQAPDAGEPGGVAALKQQIADLEEQLGKKKEELKQVKAVLEQQDHEIKEKEKSIKLLASSKAQLEEQLCQEKSKEAELQLRQSNRALQCLDAAVNTDLSQVPGVREAHDKGINVNIPLSTKSIGCSTHRADNVNAQVMEMGAQREQGLADTCTGVSGEGPGHFGEGSIEAGLHAPCFTQLQIDEHLGDDNQNHRNNRDTQSLAAGSNRGGKAGFGEEKPREGLEEEGPPNHEDLPAVDPIGQYVKKIQELLQEQWLCLEHGYPELASAIKQPASKLSSIQNQLVNSLNSLLSAYSTQGPTDKENSNTHYQQLENSPTTSLKSIMKKKGYGFHAGGNGTKKNLQFVGVNGGYETTSSEDTSCEDSPSDGDAESETERRDDDVEPTQVDAGGESQGASSGTPSQEKCEDEEQQEPLAEEAHCSQQEADRCKPSEDFLANCQLLSEHLSEICTTSDKYLRHVLGAICQEWFQVSSHKSSSPEVVAAYLRALRAIQPQLLKMMVNVTDRNGNTALHYSVSHSNFPVAKLLLDTGVCRLDLQNRAGYTAVMLTPLAAAETRQDMEVVMRLLREGDVNLQSAQGGQTALMLGVSHERDDMVRALLSCQADVNLQDEEGTTALMVACRQGNMDIVKLLLAQPGCQVMLMDKGGNSALSLAQGAAHGDIVALLRAHIEHSPSLSA
ncbi:PREDICTED: KN motif and ankyrin repeat domain-containing protein 4 isoform X1 [Lepidothrix coronata]|uniref:KN motif and ankyrin repeat domain-containing protein 4 n=1 Tax=Lepidothrix coronata TaxID=321398 RepID=A0A6J0GH01_9PASS|nr:PREDICTED: KN motif and ankyrin repeat domain-containing protein 4 isoform X1 [Lepidothrix coronata]XP_017661154.1 PREDICTED: KN motif and ankyrin repeat domain-containing protein 4 isoform X1 [Lepidothrix coronata]XP_017661155.1 PREDICTED: KN motif and ankyrin repeat domain-containing protein 4 isoform X1 [Lepidothrix coronata]XP_017661156.1 PREDICTED: KN motif and ankyrin repeat domain-containing protein 4 isoform X1 [Lepidothrix coronata]